MIELVFLVAFSVWGLHAVVDELIYTYTRKSLDDWFDQFGQPRWAQPLIFCPICMASVWGTIFYAVWSQVLLIEPVQALWGWPPTLLCVAGINKLFTKA